MQPNGHLSLGLLAAQADITRSYHLLTRILNTSKLELSSVSAFTWERRQAVDQVVAQVSNLLYRSASSLPMPRQTRCHGHGYVLPIGNRRYSRLETCATANGPDFVNEPGIASTLRTRRKYFANRASGLGFPD